MHFLNNGSIIVLMSWLGFREAFSDPEAVPPLWLVPIGVVVLLTGIRLVGREQRT